jgi:hypothetical protein
MADSDSPEDINIRAAKFWRAAINFLDTVDDKYFTPSRFKSEAFQELTIIDAKIYSENPVEQEDIEDIF